MNKQAGWAAAAALAVAATAAAPGARAQGGPGQYGFNEEAAPFNAIQLKDGQLGADPNGAVKITRDQGQFKEGTGALAYTYRIEPNVFRGVAAEARLPAGTQSVRLWVRSSTRTILVLTAREEAGKDFQLQFMVPANEWTPLSANLDEFTTEGGGTAKLQADQVRYLGVYDLATMLASSPELAKLIPDLQTQRTVWLDDLRFEAARQPQGGGLTQAGGKPAYLVDSFETGLVRWLPARVNINGPTFTLFPDNVTLRVAPEAAGPGMARTATEPGGKGLRFTYNRAAGELYALVRTLEGVDLSKATKLNLSMNLSRKSFFLIQVKEKDDSEYRYVVMPDNSTGWQNLSLAWSDFSLGDDSKDENNRLDPDQIKEMSLVDASTLAGQETGEVSLDLDALWFQLQ